jgi:arylsulfatase A-like enzyme
LKTLTDRDELKPLVRAYLASVAFVDAQVGRVLDALEATGRSKDTIVVLWSDHGYHLGEKEITGKNTLWERSTRVPLMFAGPGCGTMQVCREPVELLDVYPTLLELCGLPKRDDLEGLSLVPQLKDATTPRSRPALTTHNPGNHAVRDARWRYIRYADGAEELYDLKSDPNEWNNIIDDRTHQDVLSRLRKALPAQEAPHAPGSKHRVLMYDAMTQRYTWEGKPILPTDPIPNDE